METFEIAVDGERMGVVAARPERQGRFPAVIVCPEIFGLTHHIREALGRLARAGFIAAVPDLHHRTQPAATLAYDDQGRQQGLALLRRQRRQDVLADIGATLRALRARPDCNGKVGVLGFSAGGHIAYLSATAFDLSAVVCVYGGWITNTEIALSQPEATVTLTPLIAAHGAHVMYIVGSEDHLITADQREMVEAALSAGRVPHTVHVYQGAKHGFLFDGRDAYDAAASEDAWRRILALFETTLRS